MQQLDLGPDFDPGERSDILPCRHDESITRQVKPTISLLSDLDIDHPDILLQHQIQPLDYKTGLVFRSAIESIRGTFIASSTTGRENLVADVLENLKNRKKIIEYKHTSNEARYDFEIEVMKAYYGYIEVKGGEGNSINISTRPLSANEFGIWCHLDGAIVNQPARSARSIINRVTNELMRSEKRVDFIIYKDILCGTRTRPCPKYIGNEASMGLKTAPDIFLLPKNIPTLQEPNPDVFRIDELYLPRYILDLFDVSTEELFKHIWNIHVSLLRTDKGKYKRHVRIVHQQHIVEEWSSKSWSKQ